MLGLFNILITNLHTTSMFGMKQRFTGKYKFAHLQKIFYQKIAQQ